MSSISFSDSEVLQDVLTFAGRSTRFGDGHLRLRAQGGVLAATAAALAPRPNSVSCPTITVMRFLPVSKEIELDRVVEASGIIADEKLESLQLPDQNLQLPWAAISPPKGAWERVDAISASLIATKAQLGIAEVANQLPDAPGEEIVRTIREGVWGRAEATMAGVPLGAAYAAFSWGFVVGNEDGVLFKAPGWWRLSMARGHVLLREQRANTLGPVRELKRH